MIRRARASHWALRAIALLIYMFILGPILITAATSFNRSDRSYFPPRGLSLHWWAVAFSPQWTGAFAFSLHLAGFPDIHALHGSLWQILVAFVAAAGMAETTRCLRRKWSLYHAGVLILLYSELMILALVLFLCLYP